MYRRFQAAMRRLPPYVWPVAVIAFFFWLGGPQDSSALWIIGMILLAAVLACIWVWFNWDDVVEPLQRSSTRQPSSTVQPSSTDANVSQMLYQAMGLSDAGDTKAAIEMFTDVLAIDPQKAQACFERGMNYLTIDNHDGAIDDFHACLAIDSEFPGARDWLARAYEVAGDNERTAKEYEAVLREETSKWRPTISPGSWANCANAYENAGDIQNALRILGEYFKKYARRVNAHQHLETDPMRQYASLLLETNDVPQAMRYASRAYKSRHQAPRDILVYAFAAERSGDLPLARRLCAEAMKVNDQMAGLKELHERLNPC